MFFHICTKFQVQLSICITDNHVRETYCTTWIQTFLTSVTDGAECTVPRFHHHHYYYYYLITAVRDMRWLSWFRHCAASRKVAGSIPDGVIGIFHSHNHFYRTVAVWSTEPLTEMSTRDISWGVKAAGAWG